MKQKQFSSIIRTISLIASFLLIFTMFLPLVSLDKYIEYDFNYNYYNEDYKGYSDPYATRISPLIIMELTFSEYNDYGKIETEYKQELEKLETIKIKNNLNETEYKKLIAKNSKVNKFKLFAIYYKNEAELSRLSEKLFLYSILTIVLYGVITLTFMLSLINFTNKTKLLSISNIFSAWIISVLTLIFMIYTMSLAVVSEVHISGYEGKIIQQTTTCMFPKAFLFILLILEILFAIFLTIADKTDNKLQKQESEIPEFITKQLTTKNKYRKINSKKSKYKNGTKKKRHR